MEFILPFVMATAVLDAQPNTQSYVVWSSQGTPKHGKLLETSNAIAWAKYGNEKYCPNSHAIMSEKEFKYVKSGKVNFTLTPIGNCPEKKLQGEL